MRKFLGAILAILAGLTAAETALAQAPGSRFKDCAYCPEMVVIPAGSFTIGAAADEPTAGRDEGPPKPITLARPFALGRTEVTFDQWQSCVASESCRHRPADFGWGKGSRPVIFVSFDDALAYVDWLSKATGRRYRLPTEAEWEYAARAGTTTPFWNGPWIGYNDANVANNFPFNGSPKGEYRGRTVAVASFAANGFGLADMHGNVAEWVADCWNLGYQALPADGSAQTAGDCKQRLRRGGSWIDKPWFARSAERSRGTRDIRYGNVGFRVARDVE